MLLAADTHRLHRLPERPRTRENATTLTVVHSIVGVVLEFRELSEVQADGFVPELNLLRAHRAAAARQIVARAARRCMGLVADPGLCAS